MINCFKSLLVISIVLTLIQVVLGTQVRQFVDERVKMLGYENMHLVLDNPLISFYFHRTFSFVVFGINLWLYLRNKKLNLGFAKTTWIMWLMVIEIISGVVMYYFDFPFGMQSTHLVVASLLLGYNFI